MRVMFGAFEVDLVSGELARSGTSRGRLQEQPLAVLAALLEEPGRLVTRDELRDRLWPDDVHVDHDGGLNKAVLKLRTALGDSAEAPRFIETIPRRGYRFLASVGREDDASPALASPAAAAAPPSAFRRPAVPLAVGLALAIGVALGSLVQRPPPVAAPQPLASFSIPLPSGSRFATYSSAPVALSPDASHVAYAARGPDGDGLYVRSMEALEPTLLPGTERARSPFFFADGQWIGFESGQALKRVALSGGAPEQLCEMPFPAGATAGGADGSLIVVPSYTGGLVRLSPGPDSTQTPLATPDATRGEGGYIWPVTLPGGRGVLFTVWTGAPSFDQARVAVLPAQGEPRILLEGGYAPRYSPSGHLLFVRSGTVHAIPFDLDRLAVEGVAVPVLDDVLIDGSSGAAAFSVSETGALAYVPGAVVRPERHLISVDPTGVVRRLTGTPGSYLSPRLSPDGRRLALWIEEGQADVWTFDLARRALLRVTHTSDDHSPAWSPAGDRLALESGRDAIHHIFVHPLDGGGDRQLTDGPYHHYLGDWSGDGRWLAYTEFHPETRADVWVVSAADPDSARPIAAGPFSEREPALSPDARWIAYASNESGRLEVYLAPLAQPRARVKVSAAGGEEPAWSPRGDALFFRTGRQFLKVELRLGEEPDLGEPIVLFEGWYHDNIAPSRSYDVGPDGTFYLVAEPARDAPAQELRVVLGWAEQLRQRVPAP